MKEQHLGSDFDAHLEEEGLLEETEAVAAKRVLAYHPGVECLSLNSSSDSQ